MGAIAQLGERLLCKQEVVGSIPSGSTNLRGIAASVGKPAFEPRRLFRRSFSEGGPDQLVKCSSVKMNSRMQCVASTRRLHARVV